MINHFYPFIYHLHNTITGYPGNRPTGNRYYQLSTYVHYLTPVLHEAALKVEDSISLSLSAANVLFHFHERGARKVCRSSTVDKNIRSFCEKVPILTTFGRGLSGSGPPHARPASGPAPAREINIYIV